MTCQTTHNSPAVGFTLCEHWRMLSRLLDETQIQRQEFQGCGHSLPCRNNSEAKGDQSAQFSGVVR